MGLLRIEQPKNKHQRSHSNSLSYFSLGILAIICLVGSLQVLINLVLFDRVVLTDDSFKRKLIRLEKLQQQQNPEEWTQLKQELQSVHARVEELQRQLQQSMERRHVNESLFFPFAIRDSRRLVPTQLPSGLHIYDYVDVKTSDQASSNSTQLFRDGVPYGDQHHMIPPCQEYSVHCYKKKLLQVFHQVLLESNASYYFYIEADTDLCVPLVDLQALAVRHHPYFLATGVGASGWIMSRQFILDYIPYYETQKRGREEQPDVIARNMLMKSAKWAVTRRYLTSHSVVKGLGSSSDGLTVKDDGAQPAKHLPRCLEPHRGIWYDSITNKDFYGWDYFDFEACPDSEIFPCKGPDQIKEVFINGTYANHSGMVTIHFTRPYNHTADLERRHRLIAEDKKTSIKVKGERLHGIQARKNTYLKKGK